MWACAPVRADVGRAAASTLEMPVGGRPFALAQTYTALADDAFGMAFNPAGLARLRDSQFATQYSRGIVDNQLGYAVFATPISPVQALGLGVSYFDGGKADVFDDNGLRTTSVNFQRDLSISLGYAHALLLGGSRLNLGLAVKNFHSVIADQASGDAFAGDVGALLERPFALPGGLGTFGAALANAGTRMKYSGGVASGASSDPLPLTARLSAGWSRVVFRSDKLTAGVEGDRVFYDDTLALSVGGEYEYHEFCVLRAGYRTGSGGGLRFGVGLRLAAFSVDYGMGLIQSFDASHQLSLTYRFAIPGIRYRSDSPPSPVETLAERLREETLAFNFFAAAYELSRIEEFFPDAPQVRSGREALSAAVQKTLAAGSASSKYELALGFRAFREERWEDAVGALARYNARNPQDRDAARRLQEAKNKLRERDKQLKLQQDATIGRLFELANQAYERGDIPRAKRVLDEIEKVSRYQPAESLRRRMEQDARRRSAPQVAPPPAAVGQSQPAPAPKPTPAQVAKSEELYNEAIRDYAQSVQEQDSQQAMRRLDHALELLKDGLRLNPESEYLRSTLDFVEKELRQRRGRN